MELVKVGGFWAGKYEVSQKEYQKVMAANPSAFGGGNRPVDSVSWNEAVDFCAKLTAEGRKDKDLPEGYYYTLPTESEWESLVAGASLQDAVTSQGGNRDGTAPVGSLGPNGLGLYDMRGNVMEFCLGDTSKPYRVLRGGSWKDRIEINLRTEFRFYCQPDDKQNTFGFRVLLKKP
jgi:formylglycine-generating enzyme required for sulfatase activity